MKIIGKLTLKKMPFWLCFLLAKKSADKSLTEHNIENKEKSQIASVSLRAFFPDHIKKFSS